MIAGEEVGIGIDCVLTNDSAGTMAFLQFEAIGVDKINSKLSVTYIDHQTLQDGFENADDHCYLHSVTSKFGGKFSKAGNGICHQVHLERFSRPGWSMVGTDSHTPNGGAVGMLSQGKASLIIAGSSYGQGSSREHAAICPMYLGVKAVIAKSIERIHWSNLVNFGILPLLFEHEADYDRLHFQDELVIEGLEGGTSKTIVIKNVTQNYEFTVACPLSSRQSEVLQCGGLLNFTKQLTREGIMQ